MSTKYFVDFDGTITLEDSTALMVKNCASEGWKELNDRWERGELTTKQVARETFKLFECSYEEIAKLIDQIEVDPHFHKFLQMVYRNGEEIHIVSDGYDLLIEQILKRENLLDIPYYSNKLIIKESDSKNEFDIALPYYNTDCQECGNCKTRILKNLVNQGDRVVYIGDGYSDRCPIQYADTVYAKEKLYRIAESQGISAIAFNNFREIVTAEFGYSF